MYRKGDLAAPQQGEITHIKSVLPEEKPSGNDLQVTVSYCHDLEIIYLKDIDVLVDTQYLTVFWMYDVGISFCI